MFNKTSVNEEFTPQYEIDLCVRNSLGEVTKKRKSHISNDGYGIWEFWSKYQGKPKRHKKTVKNISEGKSKGGQNKPPRTSRPSEPLPGQG